MDDLIRRQDAIDAIDKIFPADPMKNEYTQGITCGAALATEYIEQLPSAQPEVIACGEGELKSESQWIPCSESLPISETDVLLTSWNGKQQFVGWLDFYGRWHDDDEEVLEGYEPLAWMPLPQPYKAESEDKE